MVTVARSGQNINGGTASLTLAAGSAAAPTSATIISDGANYEAATSSAGAATSCTSASIPQIGMCLIQEVPASTSATVDLASCFSATYDNYVVEATDVISDTNNVSLLMRVGTGGGPTYDAGNNYDFSRNYQQIGTAFSGGSAGTQTTSAMTLMVTVSSTAPTYVTVKVRNPTNASYKKLFEWSGSQIGQDGNPFENYGGAGDYTQTTALTALRFLMSGGTAKILSGNFRCYGLAK